MTTPVLKLSPSDCEGFTFRNSSPQSSASTAANISTKSVNNNGNHIGDTNNGSCYEPYWRDSSFYKRRLGVETNDKEESGFLGDDISSRLFSNVILLLS